LEEFPPGEEEYPGKLLPGNRNTNCFKRILREFQLGKGKTSGLIRETYSRLERVW
jgi:hypothetical protein